MVNTADSLNSPKKNVPIKRYTLAFMRRKYENGNGEILLGMKKRGFGMNKFNGFGGKVGKDENIEEAAKREFFEEAHITVEELCLQGLLTFTYPHVDHIMKVYVYEVIKSDGEPRESEEMLPKWFDQNLIPYDKMWSDDSYWLPIFLKSQKFIGKFSFAEDEKTIIEHDLQIVGQFDNDLD